MITFADGGNIWIEMWAGIWRFKYGPQQNTEFMITCTNMMFGILGGHADVGLAQSC